MMIFLGLFLLVFSFLCFTSEMKRSGLMGWLVGGLVDGLVGGLVGRLARGWVS